MTKDGREFEYPGSQRCHCHYSQNVHHDHARTYERHHANVGGADDVPMHKRKNNHGLDEEVHEYEERIEQVKMTTWEEAQHKLLFQKGKAHK